jgi:hypothetical protein
MRSIALLVVCLWSASLGAAPITIDFEDQTVSVDGPFAVDGPEYGIVDGFRFYRPDGLNQGGWIDPANIPMTGNNSSVALDWCDRTCGGDGTLAMEISGGGTFDLVGLDYSLYQSGSTMDIIGYAANGGIFNTSLVVPIGRQWQTTVLNWTNLYRVEFEPENQVFNIGFIDNVVVSSVVPIPAAVYLFASGLGLLGWLRHK